MSVVDCWDNQGTCVALTAPTGKLRADLTLAPGCNAAKCGPTGLRVAQWPEIIYAWPPASANLTLHAATGDSGLPTAASVPITNGMSIESVTVPFQVPACADQALTGFIWIRMGAVMVDLQPNTVLAYVFQTKSVGQPSEIDLVGWWPLNTGGIQYATAGAAVTTVNLDQHSMIPVFIGPGGTPAGGGGGPGATGAIRIRWYVLSISGAGAAASRLRCDTAGGITPAWQYLVNWSKGEAAR